jgi:hypothetical protein
MGWSHLADTPIHTRRDKDPAIRHVAQLIRGGLLAL